MSLVPVLYLAFAVGVLSGAVLMGIVAIVLVGRRKREQKERKR